MEIIDIDNTYNKYVHIDLNVIYMCNMKCSYCYARDENPWNVMMKKNILDVCLDRISKSSASHVNILGGEPSLYPLLPYLLNKLEGVKNVHLVKIYTNGLKDIRKYKSTKVKLVYTTHTSEAQSKSNLNEILEKIEKDDLLTIMLEDDGKLLKFYDTVKYKVDKIECNYIQYGAKPNFKSHPLDFLQNKVYVNGKMVVQKEYAKIPVKGMMCNMNYFSVNYDGTLIPNCLEIIPPNDSSHRSIKITELDKFEPYYFKCPYEYCTNVCYMYQRKYS